MSTNDSAPSWELPGEISHSAVLRAPCPAPAPLVVNGSPYVGCSREKDHDGDHEVTIRWPR